MFHEHKFGFKPWRERMFHKGGFKYLILGLLKDKPHYGYEIIRALEERFHGFYAPSPGIVYPTLQMLEEMGYVTSSQQDGKKVYTITEAGLKFLSEREQEVHDAQSNIEKWFNPEIHGKLHETVRELWDIGKLIGYRAQEIDAEKLKRIQGVLSHDHQEIESILGQKG